MDSHYDYLRLHWTKFVKAIGLDDWYNDGMISAHGDKGYSYKSIWEAAGISFNHGMLLYLLSYCAPYHKTVRETKDGWVKPDKWVIDNYPKFKDAIEKAEKE